MKATERKDQYRTYLTEELKATALYRALAEVEQDPERRAALLLLAQAEMGHASRWAQKLGLDPATLSPPPPSFKLTLLKGLARLAGTDRLLPLLLRAEANHLHLYSPDAEARELAREERDHARALRRFVGGQDALEAIRAENRRLPGTNGNLRAGVLGVNDGLVSNFSLVTGVAGGTGSPEMVLLAGVAGLLAGAFSMAAGEYVSMRSQRDVYEHQIRLEQVEIQQWPEEEEEELVLLYQSKGLLPEEARRVARRVMQDPKVALDTMAREELGLDPSQLGSPWGASISSFTAFVVGALVPLFPYIFGAEAWALTLSAAFSGLSLLLVGGLLAWMTGRHAAWGGTRMLLAGGASAAVTFGVGRLIGASLSN